MRANKTIQVYKRLIVIPNPAAGAGLLFKQPLLYSRRGCLMFVASPGIEPGSRASETRILSIVLQGPFVFQGCKNNRTGLFLLHF